MVKAASNKINIDEVRCSACGYCVQFCPQGCIEQTIDKIGQRGWALPAPARPEKCNACGICAWMCPHWAITVSSGDGASGKTGKGREVVGPPRLAQEPPFAGCAGCQHPTVGRIIAEVVDEMGLGDKTVALDSIPCSISSAFGPDFGTTMAHDENAFDIATLAKRNSPDSLVIAVLGYWGLADFSLDIGALVNTLIRGDNLTLVLCNTPYYGPKDGRPAPAGEPIEGQLEPVTRIKTPEGQQIIRGGHPLHIAEMVATFGGVAYSARTTLTSPKQYQLARQYIRTACQKQVDRAGLSFVEVLCSCCDPIYAAPAESLKWIEAGMVPKFPPGEFKNT